MLAYIHQKRMGEGSAANRIMGWDESGWKLEMGRGDLRRVIFACKRF